MLPSWVSDVIAAGSEDATELEVAYNELASSPLVKYVKPLGGRRGIYAALWCTSLHDRHFSEQSQFSQTRDSYAKCCLDLLDLINRKHGSHLEAAEAAKAAE